MWPHLLRGQFGSCCRGGKRGSNAMFRITPAHCPNILNDEPAAQKEISLSLSVDALPSAFQDGLYGPAEEARHRQFRTQNGLRVTGTAPLCVSCVQCCEACKEAWPSKN